MNEEQIGNLTFEKERDIVNLRIEEWEFILNNYRSDPEKVMELLGNYGQNVEKGKEGVVLVSVETKEGSKPYEIKVSVDENINIKPVEVAEIPEEIE